MQQVAAGQRLMVDDGASVVIRFDGHESDRVAICAISAKGRVMGLERLANDSWTLESCSQLGERFELIAYVIDDKQGGFVNQAYPCAVMLGAAEYGFPPPSQQLAAIILGEFYVKEGRRRLRVSNEGYTFGIDAYVRARDLGNIDIPYRTHLRPHGGRPGSDSSQEGVPSPGPSGSLASGSGVVVGPDLVITNAHVIEGGHTFYLGRTRQALTPVAIDPLHDLALLQGPVSSPALPIRTNAPVWLGENVMAAGYPLMDVLGADLKVTTGNISGLTGGGGDISRFQFSAPIGSGSSGGAIIDEAGNLVGITAASLAHQNMRERGSISENVNFGVRAALVYEIIAAAGMPLPDAASSSLSNRREITSRLRNSVVSIMVSG